MKNGLLWRVSVTTSLEAEEAVAAIMEKLFKRTPTVYVADESRESVISVYGPGRLAVRASTRTALARELKRIANFGLEVRPAKISVTRIAHKDWAESWKRFFKPIEIGRALLIKPSWSKRRPAPAQAVVVLDPGLSFGTGQHPTTSYCLKELVAFRRNDTRQSFLDIGTGSGILAISASKMGYEPVRAFDVDPVAVRHATSNAKRNQVWGHISIERSDLSRQSFRAKEPYDLICANLISSLLRKESLRIVNRLRLGGRLILAGILAEEFGAVHEVYARLGLRLLRSKVEKGWKSGTLVKTKEAFP